MVRAPHVLFCEAVVSVYLSKIVGLPRCSFAFLAVASGGTSGGDRNCAEIRFARTSLSEF